jgi:Mrp family chromosome partitioning ATPase/capsular polysaccharide biosynthesis protein
MIEPKQIKRDALEAPALGMKLTDILYVVFRQKWLIAIFLTLGLIAGLIVFFAQKTLYWSEAQLLVLYVDQTKSMETGDGPKVRRVEVIGETVLNSEMVMLTSLDLCEEVARRVGPERILSKSSGSSNTTAAARAIHNALKVENPRNTKIISVRFSHADPMICQVVLRQVINSYFEQHKKIFESDERFADVVRSEAVKSAGEITSLEQELTRLNRRAGVVSLEEDKKNKIEQLAHLQQQSWDIEAQLADSRSMAGATPDPAKAPKDSGPPIPEEKLEEYKKTVRSLEAARNREFELTVTLAYTEEHFQVINVRQQMAEALKKKKALEAEFPKLALLDVGPTLVPGPAEARLDPRRITALEAKLAVVTNQMAHIQPVQNPSAPAPNVSQRLKLVAGTFFGLLLAGIAIAFFIEIVVDHTIRRPGEFEAKLRLPLFLSIPKLGLNGHSKLLPFPEPEHEAGAVATPESELKQTWAADHPLRRYIDGLRDATLTHFGGDPHKPKLIGITSCGGDAGVTSIAAGLAGALSETGDGNVLLLNLNYEAEAAHPFYRGELTCGLADALELDKRVNGKVLQNLYVATAGNPNDPATQSLPKQLARIVPKLRVCDYDYIVFDLPPTTPTTMTARLAGMMDLVILVVESEKDTQESVKQASRLLARSKAPVSAVLNKVRDPVPKWLQQGT